MVYHILLSTNIYTEKFNPFLPLKIELTFSCSLDFTFYR